MKTLFIALAALPFVSGAALAGSHPLVLSDQQMDVVTAGFDFMEVDETNTSWTLVAVNHGPFACANTCYINIQTQWAGSGTTFMQIASQFGPASP